MRRTFITIALSLTTLVAILANAQTNTEIRTQIASKYPNSLILEIEHEDGNIEVEIIHEQKEKEVIFDRAGAWQSTKFDIKKSELPEKIKTVIKESQYSSYKIDDIEIIETPSKSLYEIELDSLFKDDITIYITFDGVIL